jgi:hypothetical protein
MNEQKQSEGRENNAASPVEDWEASGVFESKQKADAEQTGRAGQATGEDRSFKRDVGGGQHQNVEEARMMQEAGMADPNDLTGPAGDPAEGKPESSTYPS